ncbi:hypothetical protein ACHAWT_009163 [Skeletonema menzelii]
MMRREHSTAAAWSSAVPSLLFWGLIILLQSPPGCQSFQHYHQHSKSSSGIIRHSTKITTSSSTTDTTDYSPFYLEDFNDSSSLTNNHNNNNGLEIWLDLRGTSLSPSTALELWELEHTDNNNDNLDHNAGTIQSNVPFTKCLVSNHANNNNNLNSDSQEQMESQHTTIQVLIDDDHPNSSWGKTLPLQINPNSQQPILPDPLPAMELISQNKGQYVLLDTTKGWKKVEEELRLSYLLSLAEVISSGALPSVSSTSSHDGDSNRGPGGIGFTCLTRNEVVKVAMWIQSITNNNPEWNNGGKNARVKTLDNGLVIPEYDDNDDGARDELPSRQQAATGLQYAIVVPYDVGLLKTAAMLLLNEGF